MKKRENARGRAGREKREVRGSKRENAKGGGERKRKERKRSGDTVSTHCF